MHVRVTICMSAQTIAAQGTEGMVFPQSLAFPIFLLFPSSLKRILFSYTLIPSPVPKHYTHKHLAIHGGSSVILLDKEELLW